MFLKLRDPSPQNKFTNQLQFVNDRTNRLHRRLFNHRKFFAPSNPNHQNPQHRRHFAGDVFDVCGGRFVLAYLRNFDWKFYYCVGECNYAGFGVGGAWGEGGKWVC
jgi:hypothetical protein